MGSNMAECHPVGFQWVMAAREKGAQVIHVDPRFTRTSAVATRHVPIRPGTDIAFLGGIINYILSEGREFREYVVHYTNAATIVSDTFRDTEDLDGLFSGYDAENMTYDRVSWQYKDLTPQAAAGSKAEDADEPLDAGRAPIRDETLEDPRCVFQLLKRHYRRYTPETVADICGISAEQVLAVAKTLCENSGRERTSSIAYAVGWTHHTVGVQYIRAAAIVQLLLGNIGRPGGGILALRGHASIQGSTDIPTLYDTLPGYIPMPTVEKATSLETFIAKDDSQAGFWAHLDAYTISLLKAYYGENATAENDFGFGYLPRLTGDHSIVTTMHEMLERECLGYFVVGENPAVGSANGRLQREAISKLDWMVVRDLLEIETASFWQQGPDIDSGFLKTEEIGTEVFFFPAVAHTEKSGSFTNTQRLLQWHHKAVDAAGDARSELWFYYHLGRIIKEKLKDSTDPMDAAIQALAWEYPTEGEIAEPVAEAVLREINGYTADGTLLSSYEQLETDGSTRAAAGSIAAATKTASIRPLAASPAASRRGWRRSGAGPGPPTAASSTTAHRRTRRASRGANARSTSGGMPTAGSGRARTCPTSWRRRRRTTCPSPARRPNTRCAATTRSSCRATASAGSSRPTGRSTRPSQRTTSRRNRR